MRRLGIIFGSQIAIILSACSQEPDIPKQAGDAIFQDPKFSSPIVLHVLGQDDRNEYEQLKRAKPSGGLPRILMSNLGRGYEANEAAICHYLVENGLADLEKASNPDAPSVVKYFLFYRPELKPFVLGKSPNFNFNDDFDILCAVRSLKKITYQNQYEVNNPSLGKIKVLAITFGYTLDFKLPGLRMDMLEGKGEAFLNPQSGKWELASISLSDRGSNDVLRYLRQNYAEIPSPKNPVAGDGASSGNAQPSDAPFSKLILGSWVGEKFSTTYLPNGTYTMVSNVGGGGSAPGGTWEIAGSILTKSYPGKPNGVYTIIMISNDVLTLKADNGNIYSQKRKP